MSNLTPYEPQVLAPIDVSGHSMETASSAVAAQAQAMVQARFIVALKRPRKMDDVRQLMLKECRRPSFAKSAWYYKPIGKGVQGPSIRFAEAAIRNMTNIISDTTTLYDDDNKRIVQVAVTDLESNTLYSKAVTITKTVERKSIPQGEKPISQRVNSQGNITYTVRATDDDILNKENALISKALRTCALRLVPGDLVDECEDEIKRTIASEAAQDPDGEKKRIADGFAAMNVMPSDLENFLGSTLSQASPADIVKLRALFSAMRDGEVSMADLRDAGAKPSGADEDKKKPNKLENILSKKAAELKNKKKPEAAKTQQAATEEFTGDPGRLTPEELAEQEAYERSLQEKE